MARQATTEDAFNAVAEPQRRKILDELKKKESSVYNLTLLLGISQPLVSKHLSVLRAVDLVKVKKVGTQRIYSLNPNGLMPIYNWVLPFEQFWNESLDELENYLNLKTRPRST